MKKNMGLIDRVVRISLAVLVGVLFFTGQISGIAAVIMGIFSIAFIVTSAVGFCPLYLPLNISTTKKEKDD